MSTKQKEGRKFADGYLNENHARLINDHKLITPGTYLSSVLNNREKDHVAQYLIDLYAAIDSRVGDTVEKIAIDDFGPDAYIWKSDWEMIVKGPRMFSHMFDSETKEVD